MKNRLGKFWALGFLVVLIIIAIMLNSCAPPPENITTTNSSDSGNKNMKLIGQDEKSGIGVYKVTDGSTVCYIAVNMLRYNPASIFCK